MSQQTGFRSAVRNDCALSVGLNLSNTGREEPFFGDDNSISHGDRGWTNARRILLLVAVAFVIGSPLLSAQTRNRVGASREGEAPAEPPTRISVSDSGSAEASPSRVALRSDSNSGSAGASPSRVTLRSDSNSGSAGASPSQGASPSRFIKPAIAAAPTDESIRPPVLRPPMEDFVPLPEYDDSEELLQWPVDAPLGYSGASSVVPRDLQENSHFIPFEDRWRIGFPAWDRYDKGHPSEDDYPYVEGNVWDPYQQNVLKGDYPIIGQHTFLNLTVTDEQITEARQVPTPTSPFESTVDPSSEEFFGDPDQVFYINNLFVTVDLSHGDAGFKPADWRIKLTNVFNINHLAVDELGIVNPDVRQGTVRTREDYALEEWFVETKLADLGPDYDFMSVRAGSQFFNSDFRGFIFSDTNRAVRLFGTRLSNRDQFNVLFFDQTEKDTNSLLNTFNDRQQNTLIANYYRQDFIWPGYTIQASYHYNCDQATFKFDNNHFLVRPDPVGVFAPHEVRAHYLGFAGDGHINRLNVSHAFYWVVGQDELNPLSGRPVSINARMAAMELSYDRDWVRFRSSYFYASGDDNIFDAQGKGFDTIFDNPNFAGGQFSYWQRQQIKLFGVNLVNRMSLVPDLRSSKFQGQTNFVNPGLHLMNFGLDSDLTPRTKLITNVNFLWFDQTEVLKQFVFQSKIDPFIGVDLSAGIEHRPLLNNNVIFVGGVAALVPGQGFRDLYDPLVGGVNTLVAAFANLALTY